MVGGGVPVIRYDLAQYGLVTSVISNVQFACTGFAAYPDGYFIGWTVYVLRDTRSTPAVVAAPQGQQQIATAFTSAGGLITHPAFTAPMVVGDEILMVHPNIGAAVGAAVAAILAQTNKLAGAAPVAAGVVALWNTGVATSGLAGGDLVTIGADNIRNKIHSLLVNISAFTVGATIRVRMFQQVNGAQRQVYNQTFIQGTDPDGLWIINGTIGIHEALRVEVYSNNPLDDGVNCAYDYMLEAM